MSEYGDTSALCWKPARATFVIPPGRSDHEAGRSAGKAYGGPALTTYQRSTSAVHNYWQTAKANSLHVQGAQFTATPRKVTQEAQKDHIVLGTDNFFTNSRTKWDQYIGERPPRTRGVPGYTGVQPRMEQLKGTPDHTQRPIRACDPDGEKTHCRLIPAYAGLTAATNSAMQQSPRTSVPGLDLTSVSTHSHRGHAGREPCLLAAQTSSRADFGGVQSGPVGAMDGRPASQGSPQANPMDCSSPAHLRSSSEAAAQHAYTARAAVGGAQSGEHYGPTQLGYRPLSARAVVSPCNTGHYHASGATTCRGTYYHPLVIGSSRTRGNECYGGVRNSSNGLPPFALQTAYCRGW